MTGRKARSRATAATAALACCALLLAGCGIKRTGVIGSGHAATVKIAGGKKGVVLYFLSKEGDRLVPIPFMSDDYTIAPRALVLLLLNGPMGPAQEAGLTTALPRLAAGQESALAVSEYSESAGITVHLPFAVGGLSELARNQLVCTVGVSAVPDVLSPVTLRDTHTTLPSAECDSRR
ncbi:hypothetical protein ACGFYQ_10345 [Streptomyces sp. NPDC048258]|uniref:hypothetical protein n=1 Tax=Streptomyces sp. NPDC048258 TaxID=3365527 RepID=UPI003710CCF9